MNLEYVALNKIVLNPEIQPRIALDDSHIDEYEKDLLEGAKFPPVEVFFDNIIYWLADGFHRYMAHLKAGKAAILVNIREGSKREAMLHAVGANATHGKRRSNDDKHKAVETLLKDEEWAKWSDRQIAKKCRVCQPFVSGIRQELTNSGYKFPATRTCSDGREMDVTQIGSNRGQESQQAQASAEVTSGNVQQEIATTEPEAATGENPVADHSADATPEVENPETETATVSVSEPAGESRTNAPEEAAAVFGEVSQVEVYETPVQESETASPENDDDIPTLGAKVAELQAALQAKDLELKEKDKVIEDLTDKVRKLEADNAYYLKEIEAFSNEEPSRDRGAKKRDSFYSTTLQI